VHEGRVQAIIGLISNNCDPKRHEHIGSNLVICDNYHMADLLAGTHRDYGVRRHRQRQLGPALRSELSQPGLSLSEYFDGNHH
jgi:hypothetical protein